MLMGESVRSIAFDFNDRGIKPVAGGRWVGSTLRRVLMSPRIAGLREHNGEVVGKAVWPAIIDGATHDRLVGLLDDPGRRRENFGRPVSTRSSVWSTAYRAAGRPRRDRGHAGAARRMPSFDRGSRGCQFAPRVRSPGGNAAFVQLIGPGGCWTWRLLAFPPKSFDSAIFSLVCAYPFTLGG